MPRFTKSSLLKITKYMYDQGPFKRIYQANCRPYKRRTTTRAWMVEGRSTQLSNTAAITSKVHDSTKWRRLCLPNHKDSSLCLTNLPTLQKYNEWVRSQVVLSCPRKRGFLILPTICISYTSGSTQHKIRASRAAGRGARLWRSLRISPGKWWADQAGFLRLKSDIYCLSYIKHKRSIA